MIATWDADKFSYSIDGTVVADITAKGASDALAQQANANIRVLADRLMANTITLQEWYTGMKKETKILHMAEAALARGGFDQMRQQDWDRVEKLVTAQWEGIENKFPGLRSFAVDIRDGRYGKGENLERGFLSRSGMYGDAGRLTYENERLAMRIETGVRLEAKRVKGANDHCPDCIAWANLGWIDALEMMNKYPIGSSVCGARCWCVIVTRQVQADDGISTIGGSSGPPSTGDGDGGTTSGDERPYIPAKGEYDLNEIMAELRDNGTLAASKPKSFVWGRNTYVNPRTGGDAVLEHIAAKQGFDGLPLLGTRQEVEAATLLRAARYAPGLTLESLETIEDVKRFGSAGGFSMSRNIFAPEGIANAQEILDGYVNSFKNGEYFAGPKNRYGNGIYFWIKENTKGNRLKYTAEAAFREDARVIGLDQLQAEMKRDGYDERFPHGANHGHYAATRGYDGFFVVDEDQFLYVVLNRTALILVR